MTDEDDYSVLYPTYPSPVPVQPYPSALTRTIRGANEKMAEFLENVRNRLRVTGGTASLSRIQQSPQLSRY